MVAQFIPSDPAEKDSVLAILREHPDLQETIQRASSKALDLFPNVRFTLDTRQYDHDDPPLTLYVWAHMPWEEFDVAVERYATWLSHESGHSRDLILIMPMWDGPLETAR